MQTPLLLANRTRLFFVIASLLGATGVAAGAYASHGLAAWASVQQIEYFQLAVTYQLFHSITLLVLCVFSTHFHNCFVLWSKIFLLLGICFFSGSLYLYVLTGVKILGAITPLGGVFLIVAWLLVALAVLRKNQRES